MATSSKVLISVQHLVKEYNHGSVHALNDCNLEIKKGEVVAIIGPSGSGKSTLLRSLNLLEQPTSGAIYFDGVDLADKSVDINLHRQKMGMVFQHGVKDWVEARFIVDTDIESLGDKMIAGIEAKRAALGI